jgi:LytS/YehU family sensor histidine kinase
MSLRNLAIHLPIAILAACVHVFLISIFLNMGTPEATFKEIFVRAASNFNDSFLIYAGILAVCFSLVYSRRFRERELQTADLKNELSQAQLRALQMQLQPHFLFNTLNSISALTHKNPTAANTMIAQLSDLLRVLLKKEPPQEITLEEELGFLRTYLEIERVRFDDRLELEFNIELETLKAQIPSLILQPLIENSIRHGISKRRGSGIIRITSEKVKNRLFLEVYDNGLGLPMGMDDVTFAEGIGLRNTRHRLRKLYGEHHRFDIVAGTNQRGVRITMIIPFRTEKNGKDQNPDSR